MRISWTTLSFNWNSALEVIFYKFSDIALWSQASVLSEKTDIIKPDLIFTMLFLSPISEEFKISAYVSLVAQRINQLPTMQETQVLP